MMILRGTPSPTATSIVVEHGVQRKAGQMTSTAMTRRAVSVSTGALALCLLSNAGLLSSGTAFPDTGLPPAPSVPSVPSVPGVPTVPGVPSPDNVVTTLDQTVKQVTSTQPSTTPPSTTTPGSTTPGTTAK